MSKLEAWLEETQKGLVCLVPKKDAVKKDSMLLTSHEYSVCDCEVLKAIAVIEKLKAALERLDTWQGQQSCNASVYEIEDDDFGMMQFFVHEALAIDPEKL